MKRIFVYFFTVLVMCLASDQALAEQKAFIYQKNGAGLAALVIPDKAVIGISEVFDNMKIAFTATGSEETIYILRGTMGVSCPAVWVIVSERNNTYSIRVVNTCDDRPTPSFSQNGKKVSLDFGPEARDVITLY